MKLMDMLMQFEVGIDGIVISLSIESIKIKQFDGCINLLQRYHIITVFCCGDICIRTEQEHFQNNRICFQTLGKMHCFF